MILKTKATNYLGFQIFLVCNAINGKTGSRKNCVFPFKYKGKTYNECTTDHSDNGKPWCAYLPFIDQVSRASDTQTPSHHKVPKSLFPLSNTTLTKYIPCIFLLRF